MDFCGFSLVAQTGESLAGVNQFKRGFAPVTEPTRFVAPHEILAKPVLHKAYATARRTGTAYRRWRDADAKDSKTGEGTMRLVVSIDTEADGQWNHGAALTTRNVAFWQPFMSLCERHGALPTYLVTSEIVEDDTACECLRTWSSEGGAEVGAHLHPWTTPPFVDRPGLRLNDHAHAFPSELPDDLLRAKLIRLTDQIEERIGLRPTSYRAGRFGFDAQMRAGPGGIGLRSRLVSSPPLSHGVTSLGSREDRGGRTFGLSPPLRSSSRAWAVRVCWSCL